MDNLYHELLLELYRHPLNKVVPDSFDAQQTEHNPLCGEELTLYIRWDSAQRVATVGWQGDGCAISQTAASLLTEEIKNKTKGEMATITLQNILELLGLTDLNPTRQRCVALSLAALKKMITL